MGGMGGMGGGMGGMGGPPGGMGGMGGPGGAAERKKREEEYKKYEEEREKEEKEEAARKKKEAEDASLPNEEREAKEKKKKAEAKKNEGNAAYKGKKFDEALKLYQEAIDLDPQDLIYYTNKAAVFFELKQYDKCISECDLAISLSSQGGQYDYVKLSKALARKANAVLQLGDHDQAIELYNRALLENSDPQVKDALKRAQKMKKEDEEKKYLNPEIAEQHRIKGNEYFTLGDYPNAVKEYTEGLRRDPDSKNIYYNRCSAYIKLMECNYALKDAEKALSIDPHYVKAIVKKGICH